MEEIVLTEVNLSLEGYRVTNFGSTDGRSVYICPRPPSKAAGRRGTRRAWKRENPPGVYMHMRCYDGDGNLRDEFYC